MFQQNAILSDLDAYPIPLGVRAYIGQRAKNSFYDYVMDKFYASGLTQAQLARKIERNAGQINRMLAGPGNWTIETAAELIAAISGEELQPHSVSFKGRAKRNHRQQNMLRDSAPTNGLALPSRTESSVKAIQLTLVSEQ